MSTGNVIKCGCCSDDVDEGVARIDPDLTTPVCPECLTSLRWAQAYLKTAGIVTPVRPE